MINKSLQKFINPRNAVILLIVLESLALRYYFQRYQEVRVEITELRMDPQEKAKAETQALVQEVSRLVVLPTGEEPVVATVTDKDKLKDQPVFEKAENGDKILIFGVAKKAYIYRPTSGLIIDVLPVNIGDSAVSIPGVDEKNPLRLALYNGTATPGLTTTLENRINEKKILGVSVTAKGNVGRSYEKTVVYDLSGKRGEQAKALAAMLGGEVSTESAEVRPNADLLVVIGSNFK